MRYKMLIFLIPVVVVTLVLLYYLFPYGERVEEEVKLPFERRRAIEVLDVKESVLNKFNDFLKKVSDKPPLYVVIPLKNPYL